MKELKETVNLMESGDYKERFIAEYVQLKIRTLKLLKIVKSYFNDDVKPKLDCPIGLLQQLNAMGTYLDTLRERAAIEEIELPEVNIDEQ